MLERYPAKAGTWELCLQTVLALATFLMVAIFVTVKARVATVDVAERLAYMLEATQITGLAFLLAIAGGLLRRWSENPPLILVWAALLAVAAVAGVSGGLHFMTAL